jgi:hypothetical protein
VKLSLDFLPCHPPEVGIDNQDIGALPKSRVLVHGRAPDDPVIDTVHHGIVRVGLDEHRCPVELDRRTLVLRNTKISTISNDSYTSYYNKQHGYRCQGVD